MTPGERLRNLPVAIRALLAAFVMSLPVSVFVAIKTGQLTTGLGFLAVQMLAWIVLIAYTEHRAKGRTRR